ncbi:MAG: 2-succinyl-5-enolpyruvyl-6-hydroxy-3-cyclohexene-1-carboxylic-acid synthase [Mangrovibacterium sp.]
MISDKKQIRQLASLLHARGIEDVIISPGSRNGPLIHTFAGSGVFRCRTIVDERSAAYFAGGLSRATGRPVVLTCSSGTASLNYAPGVAEAYYLNLPLIVLTADRPPWWIDQGENQCIRQEAIFRGFIRRELSIPLGETEHELWQGARLISECMNAALSGEGGPVHLNIPLDEPLHGLLDEPLPAVKDIRISRVQQLMPEEEMQELVRCFNRYSRVLVLAGQQEPDTELEKQLGQLSRKSGINVLHEPLSNMKDAAFCGNIDMLITALHNHRAEDYVPELLISFGGQLVSKQVKQFLRRHPPREHWHLSRSGAHHDTYRALSRLIVMPPAPFFSQLLEHAAIKDKAYARRWKTLEQEVSLRSEGFTDQAPFSDLKVFRILLPAIPAGSVLHLGNSTPVRYALLRNPLPGVHYLSNRGTSGIDGCLSSAVGYASASKRLNTVILGDLAFFYDSNALWNSYAGTNLRVVVIHNGGGNIFGLIKGPDRSPAFREHFLTENRFRAKGIAQSFGLDYLHAGNEQELQSLLPGFFASRQKSVLLEIFTNAGTNSRVFRELFAACRKESAG